MGTSIKTSQCCLGFLAAEQGGVVVLFGLGVALLLGVAGVALDFGTAVHLKARLQKAADAAAIAATQDLSVSTADRSRVSAAARSVVQAELGPVPADLSIEAEVNSAHTGVEVRLSQRHAASLSKILKPEGSQITVSATAVRGGTRKVCVLGLDPEVSQTVSLDAKARITAAECAVYSNSQHKDGVKSTSSAILKAQFICSSGGFAGSASNYSGERKTDCPRMPDPLSNRPAPPVGPCKGGKTEKLTIETDQVLGPGTYCGGIEIKKAAKVTLSEGIYVIRDGMLKVDETATLYGRNVGLYFTGKDASFDFLSSSTVNLGAPKDGPMAGILFFGDRNAPGSREYKITSDNARTLLGTIYLPRGYFTVDASNPVADQSAYTAIIVRRLDLKAAPNLVLNASYHQTDVPVPQGLVPGNNVRLIQ